MSDDTATTHTITPAEPSTTTHTVTAPRPIMTAPVPASPHQQALQLPRYTHQLLPQSLVGSEMVVHDEGEWVKREDVLRILKG